MSEPIEPKPGILSQEEMAADDFAARRVANALKGLWLCDSGQLIPLEQRDKHERRRT